MKCISKFQYQFFSKGNLFEIQNEKKNMTYSLPNIIKKMIGVPTKYILTTFLINHKLCRAVFLFKKSELLIKSFPTWLPLVSQHFGHQLKPKNIEDYVLCSLVLSLTFFGWNLQPGYH